MRMLKVSPLVDAYEVEHYWINLAQIEQLKCMRLSTGKFFYRVVLSGEQLKLTEEDYNRIKTELALP